MTHVGYYSVSRLINVNLTRDYIMLPKYKDIVDLLKKGSTLEAQEQIMSLREGALELQEENQELKNEVRELKDRLKSIESWEQEKKRFLLVNPWGGPGQTYALREESSNGEPPHLICTSCYQSGKKSILNPTKKTGDVLMACPVCKATVDTGYAGIGPAKYAEKYA